MCMAMHLCVVTLFNKALKTNIKPVNGKILPPAVHWILSRQDNKSWRYLLLLLFAVMKGDVETRNSDIYSVDGIEHTANRWKHYYFFLHNQNRSSLFDMIKCVFSQNASRTLLLSPTVFVLLELWFCWDHWLFMAPISLTHVQVQYWLARSPDIIAI